MLSVLQNRTYRHLLGAQIVALSGTGLATIALGLLAYDLAGNAAGMVLGTALTIKMVAYVGIAPLAAAFAEQVDRRKMLVVLDLVRAAVAACLPFVTEVWQVYVLIFVLQSASAGFTPAFQATIPDVLTDEKDYTRALSLSRLAYDLESLLSPMLAALLLIFVSFDTLFLGTSFGFIASALLVVSVALPSPKPTARRGIYDRTTRGIRIYLATPRLRGLLALSWNAAALSAMVIVNTVVIVRTDLGLSESAVAIALAGFGGGSMVAAFTLPPLLDRFRRPSGHAERCCHRNCNNGYSVGPVCNRTAVSGTAHRSMGLRRIWIFHDTDTVRSPIDPIRPARGSACRFCRAVHAVPCLLAGLVSAGRLADDPVRRDGCLALDDQRCGLRADCGACDLAPLLTAHQ